MTNEKCFIHFMCYYLFCLEYEDSKYLVIICLCMCVCVFAYNWYRVQTIKDKNQNKSCDVKYSIIYNNYDTKLRERKDKSNELKKNEYSFITSGL